MNTGVAEREAGSDKSVRATRDIATREKRLSWLLMLYIATGLSFMLLPGTFLGVWNLITISSRHAAGAVSAAWIQAHGHAQIFGWIGTFILGIGFYSIPKLRRAPPFALWTAWSCWLLWTAGVALRWFSTTYGWHWRTALPVSAALELTAFLIFFHSVSGHRPEESGKSRLDEWVIVVIVATSGLLLALILNLGSSVFLAWQGGSPELPQAFDQRFLALQTWGFLVPFVWGFSAKWLPIFLGLRPLGSRVLLWATAVNIAGVMTALAGWLPTAALLLLASVVLSTCSLRVLEPSERPPKTRGVHASMPFFVRLAYVWAIISALLTIWAANAGNAHGIWGASRHALTVGFLGMMVFAIGQRVLPAFSGMRLLFSSRLMFAAMLLLAIGCGLRVTAEILAYQELLQSAWSWLPVSAVIEMAAVTIFAVNLLLTFATKPDRAELQYRSAA
ncbi:MAG TPA: NnrS family protein [Terriglobales bacterium]|nr:NnrS family protein [Terriglobales bacterium]